METEMRAECGVVEIGRYEAKSGCLQACIWFLQVRAGRGRRACMSIGRAEGNFGSLNGVASARGIGSACLD
jgi:hypothetical protein